MKTVDLVTRIQAADPSIKKGATLRVVTLMFAEIRNAVARGEDVALQGLGTFRMVDKPGEAAGKRLIFRPAKAVRDIGAAIAATAEDGPASS